MVENIYVVQHHLQRCQQKLRVQIHQTRQYVRQYQFVQDVVNAPHRLIIRQQQQILQNALYAPIIVPFTLLGVHHGIIVRDNKLNLLSLVILYLFYCGFGLIHIFSIFIGICGGSASGKTTVAQKIIESLDVPWVTLLSMDCFYKVNFVT